MFHIPDHPNSCNIPLKITKWVLFFIIYFLKKNASHHHSSNKLPQKFIKKVQ